MLSLALMVALPAQTAAAPQVTPPPVVSTAPEPAQTPPVVSSPAPTPTPVPTPVPSDPPSPAAAPSPVSTPAPDATSDAPAAADSGPVTPVASPTPAAPPEPVTTTVTRQSPAGTDHGGGWLLWTGIALVVAAAAIVAATLLRRRRDRAVDNEPPVEETVAPVPLAAPAPAPAFLEPVAAGAVTPSIAYRPARIGLNLVSVAVTGELTLVNEGGAAMRDVRVRVSLLAAATGHEAAVAALHRSPAARLAVPAFALAPGETRAVRLVAAAARNTIEPLTVAGRPMMVPLVAIGLQWRDDVGEHRRTQAFAVGVERVDSPKLAPVWLDHDSRSFETVAARPQGPVLT